MKAIEALREVPREFNMLFLILSHRYNGRIIEQDIRRHENGIIKLADIYLFILSLCIFERMRTRQVTGS